MTVVVTGASGHLGINLVQALARNGVPTRVLVHRNSAPLEEMDVDIAHGDVLDLDSLRSAFAGAELVYHLAGAISISGDPHGAVRAVNVTGADNVARTALRCGVRRLVHCSSIHAFDMRRQAPITESSPRVTDDPRVHRAYDRSKAEGEKRVREVIDQGLDAVIIHPTGVIGPSDHEPSRMGRFFLRLYRGTLPGLVAGAFDFVDVRDVANGMIVAADQGRTAESYLLSGHDIEIPELASMAASITGRKPPRLTVPGLVARLGTPLMSAVAAMSRSEPLYTKESLATLREAPKVDSTKAVSELGFAARPIEETVADIYRWFAATGFIQPDAPVEHRPEPINDGD